MKRIILLTFFFCTTLQFQSCKPALYRNFIKIPKNVWTQDNSILFKVNIENPIPQANVQLTIRYVEGYFYDNLKVKATRISPSNEKLDSEFVIPIKGKNGEYLGQGMGDLFDIEVPLAGGFELFQEKGMYQYEFSQMMGAEEFPLIVEVGLIVSEAEN